MFRYFPTNHVWNLSVDLPIEMGARIGEIEKMCGPLKKEARQPNAEGTRALRNARVTMADKLPVEYDADLDLHDDTWTARHAPLGANASQLCLFQHREKSAPGGPPPDEDGNAH